MSLKDSCWENAPFSLKFPALNNPIRDLYNFDELMVIEYHNQTKVKYMEFPKNHFLRVWVLFYWRKRNCLKYEFIFGMMVGLMSSQK